MQNNVSIHRSTVFPYSRRYCDKPYEHKENAIDDKKFVEDVSDDMHENADDPYVVDKVVRPNGLSSRLRYGVQRYGLDKSKNSDEQHHHISTHFVNAYWDRLDRNQKRKALLGVK